MQTRLLSLVPVLVAATLGCHRNSVSWARDPLRVDAKCVVAIDDGPRPVQVTEDSRRACVAMAAVVEPVLPDVTIEALHAGPPSEGPFRADEDVYCRLTPRPEQGGSLKFRCMRTDSANRLYDDKGTVVADAMTFDEDDVLVDEEGQPVLDEDGKRRKADELRVKYFLGASPDARYREMFTETVVSHLFWALGIPVDRVYMPASVRCFGCAPSPFGQTTLDPSPEARTFRYASVERRYEGKQINVGRRRGWMGLGGGYGHGFAFGELEGLAMASTERRIDIEVLVAALNIVGYNSPSSYQNELVCRKDGWDRNNGECTQPVAYVQDVGGTLGGEKARGLQGVPDTKMKNHPRGDWPTFSQESVFRVPERCELFYEMAGVEQLSEAGRQALDRRIRGRLGMEALLVIFQKANIHRMDERLTALASTRLGVPPGAAVDRYVQQMWADVVHRRLREILDARCPA
jgi:hypothetical protein